MAEMFRRWGGEIESQFEFIVRSASKDIKRRMRRLGMKIVVDGDSNPVQVEMDKLTAAFNAPRLAGLKEWFTKYYPEYKWVDSEWETDEEIAELKDKVYNGECNFGHHQKNILRTNLGLVKYNEFVEAYNN